MSTQRSNWVRTPEILIPLACTGSVLQIHELPDPKTIKILRRTSSGGSGLYRMVPVQTRDTKLAEDL